MIREQRIMKRIIDELGEEFDEYINTFYTCDLWKIKENELIVNRTFKRIVDIIADFNLASGDEIMEGAYKLVESNEVMMKILEYLTEDFAKRGSESLLNRTMVFCYCVFMICHDLKIPPSLLLMKVVNSDVIRTRTNFWIKIKHFIGICRYPFEFQGEPDAVLLISILKGTPIHETLDFIVEYNELI